MAVRAYHGVEHSEIWSEFELELYFRETARVEGKRQIRCGYCQKTHRAPLESQRRWFFDHECVDVRQVAA